MPTGRALLITAAAALLELLPLAVAHGEDFHGPDGKTAMQEAPGRPTIADGLNQTLVEPRSYFALPDHASAMYAHILLMVLAWIVLLPVGEYRVKP